MRYMLLGDINIIKKSTKVIMLYTFSIVIFCLFTLQMGKQIEISHINLKALGMIFSNDFLELLMYVLNFSFYIFIIMSLFLSDIKSGGQNIFSRIPKRKYIIYKIVSLSAIVFIGKLVYHLIVSIICQSDLSFTTVLVDFNYTICAGLTVINIFMINNSKLNGYFLLLLIYFIIAFIDISLLSSAGCSLLILIIINMLLAMTLLYLSKFLFKVYERNE